jgi:hypothetical protein
MDLTREQVIGHRIAAQQLDRPPSARRRSTEAAILDLGVQDTGRDGASWALVNRGVPLDSPAVLTGAGDLGLVWSLRVSPHYYRRAELVDVLTAVSPFDETDAGRRLLGAADSVAAIGVGVREAIAVVARAQRALVAEPTVKGELSTRLTAELPAAYGSWCQGCGVTHVPESLFRLAAFFGGLELEPGTSPPVLRRIPDWPRRPAGVASDPDGAPAHLQVVRGCLRLLGPATPAEVAGFLDTAATVIKEHWPDDAVEVRVEGTRKWLVGELLEPRPAVRLLGPYDLLAQGKDRKLLVPDPAHRKQLWPSLGRPGSLLADGEIVGWWRPRAKGRTLHLEIERWQRRSVTDDAIGEQAERLAEHRGLTLGTISAPS